MITPRWVDTECQPIAIRDVLRYLVAVIESPEAIGGVLEIGGPDVVTYADMMATYAEVAGLPRCGSGWSHRSRPGSLDRSSTRS
jgi:uncharacterized protein YbjT (DUF2867 family)